MYNRQKIRVYMSDAGIPKRYWPMNLEANSLNQPALLTHITSSHLSGPSGRVCGVNLYTKKGEDLLYTRDVFIAFARELVLAGFSTKIYSLIELADLLDEDRHMARKEAVRVSQVCILDFASEGSVDGLTAQQRARVQQYIMYRLDNHVGVSVHYPVSDCGRKGAAFGYSAMLLHALTMTNYNESVERVEDV